MPRPIGERDENIWKMWTTEEATRRDHENQAQPGEPKIDERSLARLVASLPLNTLALAPSAFESRARTGAGAPGTHKPSSVGNWAPVTPLGHGDCEKPRLVAYPGQAAKIAEAGIDLEASLDNAAMASTGELARYIDEYTEYTGTRPHLKTLHDIAASAGPVLLANRIKIDEKEAQDARLHEHVDDQTRNLQIQAPLPLQLRASSGELSIPIGMSAYQKSQLCRYIEEALAESYAQLKVNGL